MLVETHSSALLIMQLIASTAHGVPTVIPEGLECTCPYPSGPRCTLVNSGLTAGESRGSSDAPGYQPNQPAKTGSLDDCSTDSPAAKGKRRLPAKLADGAIARPYCKEIPSGASSVKLPNPCNFAIAFGLTATWQIGRKLLRGLPA